MGACPDLPAREPSSPRRVGSILKIFRVGMLTPRLPRVLFHRPAQIRLWFKDCINNPSAEVGFYLGLASIGCWLVAQFPQLVRNFRRKSADGLSPWFLAEWLMGDTLNLLGCLMTGDQLPSQTYTAVYFIAVDMAMIFQFVYYTLLSADAVSLITADMRDPDVAYSVRVDDTAGTHGRGDGGEGGVRGGTGRDAPSPQGGADRATSPPPTGPGEWYSRRTQASQGSSSSRGASMPTGGTGGIAGRRRRREARAAVGLAAATGVAAVVAVALAVALGLTTASRTGGVNLQPPAVASAAAAAEGIGIGGGTQAYSYSSVRNNNNDDDDDNNHGRKPHKDGLPICGASANPEWEVVIGRAVGYASSVFYLGSRLSQIYKNHSRRSCEGLAMSMFFTAACANIAYGLAILLRGGGHPTYLLNSIPWLLGSLGTVALDTTILAQSRYYTKRAQRMRRTVGATDGDGDVPEGEGELDRPLLRVD